MTDEKRCTKCGDVKPLDGFYRTTRGRDSRSSQCKPCADAVSRKTAAERMRRYRLGTPEGRSARIVDRPDPDPTWREEAACRNQDTDLWYSSPAKDHPGRALTPAEEAALAMCRDCPAKVRCREYAITAKESLGIWGGLLERELRAERRQRARAARRVS